MEARVNPDVANRFRNRCVVPILLIFALGACQHTENDVLAVADGYSSSGITNAGSDDVQPDALQEDAPERFVVPEPPTSIWPELPRDELDRIARGMTRAELIALLGEPLRKETAVQGIDTGEKRDWNAEVYTWKYQDSRLTTVEMVRDLEVRLAYLYRNQPFPGREEIVGPDWVVVGWNLF